VAVLFIYQVTGMQITCYFVEFIPHPAGTTTVTVIILLEPVLKIYSTYSYGCPVYQMRTL